MRVNLMSTNLASFYVSHVVFDVSELFAEIAENIPLRAALPIVRQRLRDQSFKHSVDTLS